MVAVTSSGTMRAVALTGIGAPEKPVEREADLARMRLIGRLSTLEMALFVVAVRAMVVRLGA